MDRRTFMIGAACSSSALAMPGLAQATERPLPLLPLADLTSTIEGRVALNLGASTHDFGNGVQSPTYGINHDYLGPVLRVRSGQTLPIDVFNGIENVSTIHWHGLHIPGEVDGGPHQEIAPGATWSPEVPIAQRASMNWFHSHQHGRTAQQTYRGLAGVMLIEDDDSLAADLPQTYGVDDFTLILQDKMFDEAGMMTYALTETAIEDGYIGDTLIVNGVIAPVAQTVPTGLVRLRILNACNSNFLTLSLSDGPLHVIASEGGFLARTVQAPSIEMSPGERYEVLVDMRQLESVQLVVGHSLPETAGLLGLLRELVAGDGREAIALTLTRRPERGFDANLPDALAIVPPADPAAATRTRTFELQQDTGADLASLALFGDDLCGNLTAMKINGRAMDMGRIDEDVAKGDTEVWRITVDDMDHPFHIHGCSFRILAQGGAEPPGYATGWKDMVHVAGGAWSEVLVRFDHPAPADAPYMYHCHILEHEDCGMMGQFSVT